MSNETPGLGDTTTPWIPMSDPVDIKHIGKLLEEGGESVAALGQAIALAARCLIQGMDGINPDTGVRNKEQLENEFADVIANIRLNIRRFGLNDTRIECRAQRKFAYLTQVHAGAAGPSSTSSE